MDKELASVSVKMKFRLEKFDAETGECVEVIEGADDSPPVVVFKKEQDNGTDNCG